MMFSLLEKRRRVKTTTTAHQRFKIDRLDKTCNGQRCQIRNRIIRSRTVLSERRFVPTLSSEPRNVSQHTCHPYPFAILLMGLLASFKVQVNGTGGGGGGATETPEEKRESPAESGCDTGTRVTVDCCFRRVEPSPTTIAHKSAEP